MFLFLPVSNFGQWNFSVSTFQTYSDNPFRSVNAQSDIISTFDVGVEKEWDGANLLYYGSYTNFMNSSSQNYYWHQLGVYFPAEKSIFGAYFEQRINKTETDYFDYSNIAGYFRYNFSLSSVNLTFNSALNFMNYSNLPEYNNWVGNLGLKAIKSFETKTTFIGTLLFNYKGFKNYTTPDSTDYEKGRGQGRWRPSEDANISQIIFNGRIAQSLFENTGLAFNFQYKNILSGSGFSASLFESTYGDMELYDDPISQQGYSFGGMLTQILPLEITFRLNYAYFYKDYPSQGIYYSETEFDDGVSRLDYQNIFSASFSKTVLFGEETGSSLKMSLHYGYINNNSNSYYYNYRQSSISFNFSFNF
ncbi:MAG: hypothetical protein GXO87_03575 [Chlorobi bacterium]|nr:hypothetical protein [Chlorobiota bacterium]